MAIAKRTVKGVNYLSYHYRDGDKQVWIYCGKEGDPTTIEKLKDAKKRHYDVKMRRAQRLLE